MPAILNVVVPVFMIVGLGWGAVRFGLFPKAGVGGLIAFVNNFAVPCLLFQAMLHSDFGAVFDPAVIGPFYIGAVACFGIGIAAAQRLFRARPGEAVTSGFSAMFTNTVLLGVPIVQRAYGEAALPTAFSIIALHAATLITLGMVTMELMRRDGAPIRQALATAGLRVAQNPLLWGVGLGVLGNVAGLRLIAPAEAFLGMMTAAVLPVSLFGLGGALNAYRLADHAVQAALLSGLKLVVHPAIAWVLMVPVLGVDREVARIAVVLAAMPTGINAYVFATYYERGVGLAANTVLLTTLASVVTVTAWLAVLGV